MSPLDPSGVGFKQTEMLCPDIMRKTVDEFVHGFPFPVTPFWCSFSGNVCELPTTLKLMLHLAVR